MNPKIRVGWLVLALAATQIPGYSNPVRWGLEKGETKIVHTFENEAPYVSTTEGIAIDHKGNRYVSYRSFNTENGIFEENVILKFLESGEPVPIADFGPAVPGCLGILGLTTDQQGDVYAAVMTGTDTHGVWKVDRQGNKEFLEGSNQLFFPNALTFDHRGNLYVSDSFPVPPSELGLIWKYTPQDKVFKVWAASELLAPDLDFDPFPYESPGVNGIVFVPPNSIYAANTEKSLILRVPMTRLGTAGEIEVVAGQYPLTGPPSYLFAPDGLAADVQGNLYTVSAAVGKTGFPLSPVVKIYPKTGAVEAIIEPFVEPSADFDFPTSLAFGADFDDRRTVYVVSITAAVFGAPAEPTRIVQVGVGVPHPIRPRRMMR